MKRKILVIYLFTLLMIPLFASTAMANEPPTAPLIDGPTTGIIGELLTYNFTSTDPEGDDISYLVRWDWSCGGDQTSDFVPSGEPVTMTHTYNSKGTYSLRAMARDVNQAESNWSELDVTIPRTRVSSYLWFEWLLERFPMLERLLDLIR